MKNIINEDKDELRNTFKNNFCSLLDSSYPLSYYAEELNTSAQNVANWSKGKATPDALTLMRISNYFNVSIDWLLGKSEVKTINTGMIDFCNYTGLSEYTIESLHLSNTIGARTSKVLNALFEKNAIWNICGLIANSSDSIKETYYSVQIAKADLITKRIEFIKEQMKGNAEQCKVLNGEIEHLEKRLQEEEKELKKEKAYLTECTNDSLSAFLTTFLLDVAGTLEDPAEYDEYDVSSWKEKYLSSTKCIKEIDKEISLTQNKELIENLNGLKEYHQYIINTLKYSISLFDKDFISTIDQQNNK